MSSLQEIKVQREVADTPVDVRGTEGGDIQVAQALPIGAVLTAKGYGWQAITTVGVAGLVVRPSTVPLMSIYNGEAGGGKVYIIDRVFAFNLVSTAAAAFWSIWLCVQPVGTTASASVITPAMIRSTRGAGAYGGLAKIDDDTTCVDSGWFPWGPIGQSEATGVLPSGAVSAEINGRIVIPPTSALNITVVTSAVGQTFTAGVHWFEVPQSELGIG